MTADVIKLFDRKPHSGGRPPENGEPEVNLECFTYFCEIIPEESLCLFTIALPINLGIYDGQRLINRFIEIGNAHSVGAGSAIVIITSINSHGNSGRTAPETTITIPVYGYNAGSCMAACNSVLVTESLFSRIEHDVVDRKGLKKTFPEVAARFYY